MMLPLADHGDLLVSLPFVVPALLIAGFLLQLAIRDRLARRRQRAAQSQSGQSGGAPPS